MDMVPDPRLQQFPFDSTAFPFPHQPTPSEHAGQYDGSLSYGIPIHHRGQEQHDWNNTSGMQQHIHNNQNALNNVSGNNSPQGRLRNGRNSQQAPLGNRGTASPKSRASQRSDGLVFKNASSNFPQGAAAIQSTQTLPNDSSDNIYLPLDQTTTNYFPDPIDPTLTPPDNNLDADLNATTNSNNPFSNSFPLVPNPSHLPTWRHKLFNITQPLHLTESQFLTYFPHIDNVYSHRSTQKYKRKPFVSHYWDCRLKGRPSGTKKSDDPNKKKRKREKRERDLCDVKIKITEWFGEEEAREMGVEMEYPSGEGLTYVVDERTGAVSEGGASSGGGFAMLEPAKRFPPGHPGAEGKRWYTIQRVNGSAQSNAASGLGNEDDIGLGSGGGLLGDEKDLDHKHSLEESDRIKKNSVQRWLLKEEKEKRAAGKKKSDGPTASTTASPVSPLTALLAAYRATGLAYSTQTSHSAPAPTSLTFFGNAYCPFAQRIWIALELKGLPYQYVECVPPYLVDLAPGSTSATGSKKPPSLTLPKELLEVNPEGNIPCIRHGNWAVWESSVMMEYLEDLEGGTPENGVASLLPPRGKGLEKLRAHCRLWVDHVERKVLPAFYAVLLMPPPASSQQQNGEGRSQGQSGNTQGPTANTGGGLLDGIAQEASAHTNQEANREMLMQTLQSAITKLVNASHAIGPFFLGESISYVDVAFAPWIIRLSRVLERYRGWNNPDLGARWQSWVNAVEGDERVRRTVSKDESYHSVYRGVGEDGWESGSWVRDRKKSMLEMAYARQVIAREGFGLGGDRWGQMGV